MSGIFKAREIAGFYIQLIGNIPDDYIDNLKLNKILYYAQAWSLARLGRPLFEDEIQAWDYGPVVPEVYHTYKCCGKNPIIEAEEPFDEARLDAAQLELLIDVYRQYGRYTGWALKDMTHAFGTPWRQVYRKGENRVISLDIIKSFFENEKLESFDAENLNIPVADAVPAEWDNSEDGVYG